MNKLLKNPKHVAQLSKYGHDMSHEFKFSSCVGQLLPVYYDDLYPGDKVRFDTTMFTQLGDIVGPAMVNIEQRIDWYFVPYRQLYQFADDNLFSINNSRTSYRENIADTSVFPQFKASSVELYSHIDGDLAFISQLLEDTLSDDLTGSFGVGSANNPAVDSFGVPNLFNALRLFQLLGYGDYFYNPSADGFGDETFNFRYFLAYQKIWYDRYRLTDRIDNDVVAYNVDYLSGIVEQEHKQGFYDKLLKLHYVPWKRDFFTSMQVAPLIDVGSVGMQSETTHNRLTQLNNWLSLGSLQNSDGGNGANEQKNLSVSSTSAGQWVQNTALFRSMFAAEKLMEITRRAAKRYDAQVLAHFGFDIPEGISNEVYYLGSDKSYINVNEVIATSAGTNGDASTNLGQKGGRGAGFGKNKPKSFTAPCHGILMGVFSATPDANYKDNMVDRLNTYSTRYDFFQPEFDKLGMQPVWRYQLIPFTHRDTIYNFETIGWQYRYSELKAKINKVNGAMRYLSPYKEWSVFREVTPFISPGFQTSPEFFYVGPNAIDNILLLHSAYQGSDVFQGMETVYFRDSLFHWFSFNVYKSSVMSNYSLPSL